MKIDTRLFGALEIKEDDILHFPHGIPGFEHTREFTMVHLDNDIPFSYLQCIDAPELSLLLADPFLFYPEYAFDLGDSVRVELEVNDASIIMVRTVVSMKDHLHNATMNLLAPIVINTARRIGKQVVLHHTSFSTRHKLLEQPNARSTIANMRQGGY